MNLHYSQTLIRIPLLTVVSYTSMNLHYSQTMRQNWYKPWSLIPLWIYITLKLTVSCNYFAMCLIPLWIYITLKPCHQQDVRFTVLYLYEFTLLSNDYYILYTDVCVLYLYEFTLLSNCSRTRKVVCSVLYLYEFTLLSNDNGHYARAYTVLYLYEFTLLSNL